MTRPLRALILVLLLSSSLAEGGLEFTDQPQVKEESKRRPIQVPAPAAPVDENVSAYTEMLKEDDSSETEFQTLRGRIQSRQVSENETESEAVQSPPAKKFIPLKPAAPKSDVKPVRAAPAPTAEMDTETVTPQGPKHPANAVSSTEPAPVRSDRVVPTNVAFPYTHMLPSPFNLGRGEWVFGSTFGYGVFDALELSTNVVRLAQQQWNIQAKVPLIEYPTFMATAYVAFESTNPHSIDDGNTDFRLNRWQPGIVTAYEIADDMAFFHGGNFDFGVESIPVTTNSGYLKGARLEADFSWLYNPQSSRLGNNAISTGVTYDTTYEMLGFGLTHHWQSFSLGLHYSLADRSRFLPIFGFNVAARF